MKYKDPKDGEIKVVVQNAEGYDQSEESRALLKILALSSLSIEQGKYRSAEEAFALLKSSLKT